MPFTPIAAPQIDLLQNAVDGDVFIPSFSRRSFLQGATAGLLSLAPALTMVGNLLTVDAPVRNYSLATFAGLGLSIETTVVAGNFPVVANRDVQVKNVASTGHTYTYPTSRRLGQLLVMAVATAALTTITTPSGWTLVQSQAGTESRTSIFTRVIDGLEPSTELLAFGTASGAVVRTWMIDIGDSPVEAVAGINDSAAGTSLDLATISPSWAAAEATNTLYIAVLGLADDVTVSGFPAGYTVTGQDASVSGTANVDCALAYAERAALGSSENPGAFTYAASRSTGHVLAIKPKVTARLNWDGLTVRKNSGADVGTRRRVNLIEGAGVTLTVADDGTEIDVTIAAASGSAHTLRDDGVDMTQRAAANFVTSATITAILTDDGVNNETEITFQLGAHTGDVTSAANSLALTIANNAVTNAKAADMPANTVKVNNTGSSGDPVDMAVSANNFVGRLAANIVSMTGTQATTLIDTFTSVLKGLAPASGGGTTNFLRADGTWAAPPGTLTAGHVIRDDGIGMTQRAALNFVTSTTITAILTDDSINGETEVTMQLAGFTGGDVTSSANSLVLTIVNNSVTNTKAADMPANTVKVNNTASSGDPVDMAVSTNNFVGRLAANIVSITGTQATTLIDTFTSALKGLAPASGGGTTNFLRADGTWAAPPGSVGSGVATSVLGVAGGAGATRADIQATTNDTLLQRSAGVLVWGLLSNAMIPQGEIGLDKLIGGEQEVTTTGTLTDLARTLDRTNVVMFSGASAQTLNSLSSSGYNRGFPITLHSQGASVLDIVDNGAGTASNIFAHYKNKTIRFRDDEGGLWVPVDLSAGGTDSKRWLCVTHRWPFHNSPELKAGSVIAHNGEDWEAFDYHFNEEYLAAGMGTSGVAGDFNHIGSYRWQNMNADDGQYFAIDSEPSHFGIVSLVTNLNGAILRVTCSDIGQISQISMADLAYIHFIVRVPTTGSAFTNASYFIGFAAAASGAAVDADTNTETPDLGGTGIGLHKAIANSTWHVRDVNAGAATSDDTGLTATLNDWVEIEMYNRGSGNWDYVINGTAGSTSGVQTSGMVFPIIFLRSVTALTRTFHVDKFEFGLRAATDRFTP